MNTPRITRQLADGLVYIARTGDKEEAARLAELAKDLDDTEELWNTARRAGLYGKRLRQLIAEQEERDAWLGVRRRAVS